MSRMFDDTVVRDSCTSLAVVPLSKGSGLLERSIVL